MGDELGGWAGGDGTINGNITPEMRERAAAEERARAKAASLDGFENTLSAPSAARAITTLTGDIRSISGEFQTRRDYIRKCVLAGSTVGVREGKPALIHKDGTYMRQSDITKTAIDYARYLISRS